MSTLEKKFRPIGLCARIVKQLGLSNLPHELLELCDDHWFALLQKFAEAGYYVLCESDHPKKLQEDKEDKEDQKEEDYDVDINDDDSEMTEDDLSLVGLRRITPEEVAPPPLKRQKRKSPDE